METETGDILRPRIGYKEAVKAEPPKKPLVQTEGESPDEIAAKIDSLKPTFFAKRPFQPMAKPVLITKPPSVRRSEIIIFEAGKQEKIKPPDLKVDSRLQNPVAYRKDLTQQQTAPVPPVQKGNKESAITKFIKEIKTFFGFGKFA